MDDDIALAKPQEERKKGDELLRADRRQHVRGGEVTYSATTPEPVDDRLTQRERTDRLGICVRVARSRERLLDDGGRGVDGRTHGQIDDAVGCSFARAA